MYMCVYINTSVPVPCLPRVRPRVQGLVDALVVLHAHLIVPLLFCSFHVMIVEKGGGRCTERGARDAWTVFQC